MAKIKGTQNTYPSPIRQTRWVGIIFFIVLHAVGLIGTPLYLIYHGASAAEWVLFGSFFALTSLAITVGYHRFFAHVCFKANPVIRFLLLFFGAATFEQSALKWASQHRQHHQFTDTDQDPYNIKRGFWYAHMNWILLYKHRVNYDNVKDLQKSKLVMNQHFYYSLWSVGAGIALPMLIGVLIGHPLGAFIMAVNLRLVLVIHSAFFINSWAHMFGTRNYDGTISARDNWFGVFLTNGEGYHNFHHRFPNDYRNGIRWYDWDPSKWLIFGLSKLNLTWDLKRTPDSLIRKYAEETGAKAATA
ncbi:MAG TPA: fatty acid desaturase [Verrucomicrobiae bacterium]|jgi:stearoyl-CoA desaturase (delta-9 desaturase)|nr:fatty acid desaturase [Verrucomicrobiae bacterium]